MMLWIFFFWNVVSLVKRKFFFYFNVYFLGYLLGIEIVSDRLKKLERNNIEKLNFCLFFKVNFWLLKV